MTLESAPPLPPPPRKAYFRRGIRNARRGYRTLFALVIVVFAGWAALDVFRWYDLTCHPAPVDQASFDNDAVRRHARNLAVGHGLAALLAIIVLRFIERPLRRELRLARRGEVAVGHILAIRPAKRRRRLPVIAYAFPSPGGALIESSCVLPRRVRTHDLAVGMAIEVLFDPRRLNRNKPRLALDHVEFGERPRKTPASA